MTKQPPSIAVQDLPGHLAERIRPQSQGAPRSDAAFILYWMRTAVRAHENPALDTCLVLADRLDLPVFVYHALSERYPFASDRHHRFILEGARDVQRETHERGIGYAFHLERPGHRGPHLRSLATQAALVVTEDMPVRPLRQWTQRLVDAVSTPVWCVDTACVVPARLAGKAYDRAFAYRRATEKLRDERVGREWQEIKPRHAAACPELPFEPVDLQCSDLADLVASCEIDHSVGPVPHTRGGSAAGYQRWEAFKSKGLARYAATRNDPLKNGVSRMSPYLHYGHVSPFRLAREAAALLGSGPQKYLDELLVWRELAYTYCLHREDHESLTTLPAWASETLSVHQSDDRPSLFSWEALARARTGDPLWDAAQTSLLIHGELHNNVRMTWGKALLEWTPDAARALELLIDLNHRYALDGRDPNSYGGILWCLGQFDRPFPPERPILGSVRPRPTEQHARRLDVVRYRRQTSRPAVPGKGRIGVVGGGVAGLICARTLLDHGLDVVVFDKGSRPGGRLATRKTDAWSYDHGAQYFTARDPRFAKYVHSWTEDGLVAEWHGRILAQEGDQRRSTSGQVRRHVGVPEMNSVAAHLAADCEVRAGVRIQTLARFDRKWSCGHEDGEEGPFDAVVVALPAPQALPLLENAPGLQSKVAAIRMYPCWAVLVTFEGGLGVDFDGLFVNEGPLSWVARDGSKPHRAGETWVLHASAEWTEGHLDNDPDQVSAALTGALTAVVGAALPETIDLQAHLWRYAIPETTIPAPSLFDSKLALAVCGDWCGGPRVEGAFLSGSAAAGRILGWLGDSTDEAQPALF